MQNSSHTIFHSAESLSKLGAYLCQTTIGNKIMQALFPPLEGLWWPGAHLIPNGSDHEDPTPGMSIVIPLNSHHERRNVKSS